MNAPGTFYRVSHVCAVADSRDLVVIQTNATANPVD